MLTNLRFPQKALNLLANLGYTNWFYPPYMTQHNIIISGFIYIYILLYLYKIVFAINFRWSFITNFLCKNTYCYLYKGVILTIMVYLLVSVLMMAEY